MNNFQKIIVAMSGGVDSAVCACLLKQQNYQLQAVFMRNWDSALNNDVLGKKNYKSGCNDLEDYQVVQTICKQLNIPLKIYNFVDDYWNEVFQPTLNALRSGLTPNADVLCNRKIKFGKLLEVVEKDFGSNIKIATGHYAGIEQKNNIYYLLTATDFKKDQTYFLSQLNQNQLSKIIFPLATISSKELVRKMAQDYNLPVWNKRDSTGICFIGERKFKLFIQNYLPIKQGKIIHISTNKFLGNHDGLAFYTIGQRKGLGVSGQANPMFVCGKNFEKNFLYVCNNEERLVYLFKTITRIQNLHWINQPIKLGDQVYLRFRHTGKLVLAKLVESKQTFYQFKHEKVNTTAPGQYVVIYSLDQKKCLGGGIYDSKM